MLKMTKLIILEHLKVTIIMLIVFVLVSYQASFYQVVVIIKLECGIKNLTGNVIKC